MKRKKQQHRITYLGLSLNSSYTRKSDVTYCVLLRTYLAPRGIVSCKYLVGYIALCALTVDLGSLAVKQRGHTSLYNWLPAWSHNNLQRNRGNRTMETAGSLFRPITSPWGEGSVKGSFEQGNERSSRSVKFLKLIIWGTTTFWNRLCAMLLHCILL
jgi:hypothetical protein